MATILTKPGREYKDVDFSFVSHPETNNVLVKSKANAVKQSVINLLTLKQGDKPFHPEIRSPIYSYLFENFNVLEKIVLEGEIKNYLTNYEPRLEVTSVTITQPNSNFLNCEITGTIINLTEPFSVNLLIDRLR